LLGRAFARGLFEVKDAPKAHRRRRRRAKRVVVEFEWLSRNNGWQAIDEDLLRRQRGLCRTPNAAVLAGVKVRSSQTTPI
jgi:hypothetical protein